MSIGNVQPPLYYPPVHRNLPVHSPMTWHVCLRIGHLPGLLQDPIQVLKIKVAVLGKRFQNIEMVPGLPYEQCGQSVTWTAWFFDPFEGMHSANNCHILIQAINFYNFTLVEDCFAMLIVGDLINGSASSRILVAVGSDINDVAALL